MSDWRKLVSDIQNQQTHPQNTQKSALRTDFLTSECSEDVHAEIETLQPTRSTDAVVRANGAIKHGRSIYWQSQSDGKTKGPAIVDGTFQDRGTVWVWFTYEGIEHLMSSTLIVKLEPTDRRD
jgi:hypothetical protein